MRGGIHRDGVTEKLRSWCEWVDIRKFQTGRCKEGRTIRSDCMRRVSCHLKSAHVGQHRLGTNESVEVLVKAGGFTYFDWLGLARKLCNSWNIQGMGVCVDARDNMRPGRLFGKFPLQCTPRIWEREGCISHLNIPLFVINIPDAPRSSALPHGCRMWAGCDSDLDLSKQG